MGAARPETFLARDAYSRWRRAVAQAKQRIVIFSPFLDDLVPRLLAASTLPALSMTVVTDLSPTSGARDYTKQLRAITRLLDLGVDVRSLDRLHAKVLLVDDAFICVGSQNFTTFARKSLEATVAPTDSLDESTFLATLQSWLHASTPIDEELVEMLLRDARPSARQVTVAQKALEADVHATRLRYIEAKAERLAQEAERTSNQRRARFSMTRLQGLRSARRTRISEGEATLRRVEIRRDRGDTYVTLEAAPTSTLTSWIVEDRGQSREVELNPFLWYPVMKAGTGQMACARITKTRVTYVKYHFSEPDPITMSSWPSQVAVHFPENETQRRNIVFSFSFGTQRCDVDVLFDGNDLHIVDARAHTPKQHSWFDDAFLQICCEQFQVPRKRRAIFQTCFQAFPFKEVGIHSPNATNFFDADDYEIQLIEYAGVPVLVAGEPWIV